ncbi:Cytoplasmic tRNA 2-thiolation protein 2 [Orchesella cincta]|uniref:Cytoplasmic tRNA 2-thiolation protein 2 n=1 Tax=Orchesella cincta TaxID=48709 RepID=A0A1D2N3P7_ORCCI|nr:Cytoplasmic tRNA 2-thiolation protein 2 [Orchesella cincta]
MESETAKVGVGRVATVISCSECDSKDVIIKKARKAYCRPCWKYHCDFRFRKRLFEFGRPAKGTIGEVFRPAEQVLICYDGSPTSVALINLALNALVFGNNQESAAYGTSSNNLPFPFKFSIVVILESELNGSPGVEGRQKKHLHSLLSWTKHAEKCSDCQFPLLASCVEMSVKEYHKEGDGSMSNKTPIVVKLTEEGVANCPQSQLDEPEIQISNVDNLGLPFNESLDHHLMELRKSLKGKTEDKDFLTVLKLNLVHQIAEQFKISKILLPEDQTSLAVKMFTMMSLGRGSQVAEEMSFTSTSENGSVYARPLIDFSDDDLRGYLETLNNECTDGLVNKSGKRKLKIDSVDRQCDDFIVNLQKGYPATVSTLTRIGSKLQSGLDDAISSDVGNSKRRCQFCNRQSDCASDVLCYGCQHFLNDVHPDKKGHFRNLFLCNPTAKS